MTIPTYVLDFRVLDVGGPIGSGTFYTSSDARMSLAVERQIGAPGGHVLFLIHGFNNGRREGREGLLGLAARMEAKGVVGLDAMVVVLWPGDTRWKFLTYSGEERDADEIAARLTEVILTRLPAVRRVSFAAHSLGSRVTLEAANRLRTSNVALGEVVLMAAAVDQDALARPDRYRTATEACRRVSNLSSPEDRALRLGYPFGDALAAILFGGYTTWPLGLFGPTRSGVHEVPANVHAHAIPKASAVGHSDYLPHPPVNVAQDRAAGFAADAVSGVKPPRYP